jgi:hypothetical protein
MTSRRNMDIATIRLLVMIVVLLQIEFEAKVLSKISMETK